MILSHAFAVLAFMMIKCMQNVKNAIILGIQFYKSICIIVILALTDCQQVVLVANL